MTRTLLCYGDSNTHGTMPMASLDDNGRFPWPVRWTGQLSALMPGWHVIEEGLPGRTTVHDDPIEGEHRNGLSVLPAILNSHAPIDVVILMLGTNDLKERFSVNAMDISLSLERLVEAIRASGAGPGQTAPGVILVAPPPILEVDDLGAIFRGGAQKSLDLSERIEASAQRLGVPFIDAADLIGVSEIDGIHYDEAAQVALAAAFAQTVRDHFD
ncbi:MAG: hydrolase [Cereibacter sphaeroides]|uniref:Hydrolase n=1 Tax=Cereibacter sphaeroides TaxID=1063 RepID=A0A2W5S973_CERSP|nr:MAG: hydrolase [Cereibacter sphaeroides]